MAFWIRTCSVANQLSPTQMPMRNVECCLQPSIWKPKGPPTFFTLSFVFRFIFSLSFYLSHFILSLSFLFHLWIFTFIFQFCLSFYLSSFILSFTFYEIENDKEKVKQKAKETRKHSKQQIVYDLRSPNLRFVAPMPEQRPDIHFYFSPRQTTLFGICQS